MDSRSDTETNHEHKKRTCNVITIAECITFENSHEVVSHIVNTNQIAAKALKDELDYWNDKLGSL